jgi:hypothetical protein
MVSIQITGTMRGEQPSQPSLVYRKLVSEEVGVGLFAACDLQAGDLVLVEDPLVFVLDDELDPKHHCGRCGVGLDRAASLINTGTKRRRDDDSISDIRCVDECGARFCSLECRCKAFDLHAAECPCGQQGRAFHAFLTAVKGSGWHSCLAMARLLIHVIISTERDEAEGLALLSRYLKLTRKSISITTERRVGRSVFERDVLPCLTNLLRLFKDVFARSRRQHWPPALQTQLTLKSWLEWIGAWGMNVQEQGLYDVQSAINHACAPNVMVEHRDGAARIHVVAIWDVRAHEQLYHCYLDPSLVQEDVCARRRHLWIFYDFDCDCNRCCEEAQLATATTTSGSPAKATLLEEH